MIILSVILSLLKELNAPGEDAVGLRQLLHGLFHGGHLCLGDCKLPLKHLHIETLTVKVDLCTLFHNLAFGLGDIGL